MPTIKTILKVFVGSSGPETAYRDHALRMVDDLNSRMDFEALGLRAFDYRQLVVQAAPFQNGINREIERADLTILVIGENPRSGLQEEIEVTTRLLLNGVIGTALYYFVGANASTAMEQATPQATCAHFIAKRQMLFYEAVDVDSFNRQLDVHLQQWINQERLIVERRRTLEKSGFFEEFRIHEIPLADRIIELERLPDDDPYICQQTKAAYEWYISLCTMPPTSTGNETYYLIARYLLRNIALNKWDVFSRKQFVNEIHQHLSSIVRDGRPHMRQEVTNRLREWLNNRRSVPEISRNFAAYELGMCLARDAADDLLAALVNPRECKSVRYYSALALGKLRDRGTIIPLLDQFAVEADFDIKEAMRIAVLFLVS